MDKITKNFIDLVNNSIVEFIEKECKKPTIIIVNKKLFNNVMKDWYENDKKPYYYDGMKIITTKDIDDLLFC